MLDTDNVHPDVLGAKALYMQLVHDFPELMCGGKATVYEQTKANFSSSGKMTIEAPETIGKDKMFTFTADLNTSFTGTLIIGNGNGTSEGSTYLSISSSKIEVYQILGGQKMLVASKDNTLKLEDIITVKIHVSGTLASVYVQSTGETGEIEGKLFGFDSIGWTFVGDAYAEVSGMTLYNASLKWYTV